LKRLYRNNFRVRAYSYYDTVQSIADIIANRYSDCMDQSAKAVDNNRAGGLREIFPTGEIFLVSDDPNIQEAAARYDLTGHALDAAEDLPDGASVVLVLRSEWVSRSMRQTFERMKVLVIPITSFDPSLDASLYTLKLVTDSDYGAACEMNQYWADNVVNAVGPLVFEGKETEGNLRATTSLSCTFGSEIEANAWMRPTLDVGHWVSVGSYCEFSMTAPSSSDWCGRFTINGTATASGVLVAEDVRSDSAGKERIRQAKRLREELVARAPIVLRLEDGMVTSVVADGEDFTDAVRQATNPDYGLHALELGLGTNMNLLPQVDWTYNSQMNEGAGAVHIGIGEGITGAHMDFVVAESRHWFKDAS
jgi:hypothetical protein